MTMEFVPTSVPSTGSLYTDKDCQSDDTSKLHLFRFGTSSDLFAPMHYNDKEETAAASPTERDSGLKRSSTSTGSKHDVSGSSNQVTHEQEETTATTDGRERPLAMQARKTSRSNRRKNSIEMFLSQSPSQALGGDFLKLSLDDRQLSLHARDLHASNADTNGSTGTSAPRSGHVYATGHFQLNAGADDALSARYRHPPPAPGRREVDTQQGPSSLARDRIVPSPSSAPNVVYDGAYTLPPPLNDSWANQDAGPKAMYPEHMHEYYGTTPMARAYLPDQQYRHQQYRGPPGSGAYGYGHTPARVQLVAGQWNPMVAPPTPLYDGGSSVFINPRASPMRHPLDYMSQPIGMRHHAMGRTHGRNVYARIAPPLPEASPPHSPRKGSGLHVGMKQCKFFAQGHCRMGNKCKFVHPGSAPTPEPGRTPNSLLYAQRMMLSPPPSHMMHPQRHQGDDGGPAAFPPPRMGFRTKPTSGNGMNAPMMTPPTSMLGTCTTDSSTLSAALSVEDIQNRVFAMSKDQNGCRLLQEQLDYEDRTDLCDVIYQESLDHLAEMMVDPFGNYLFQKLLERVNEEQRVVIIRRVSSNLVAAALNLHGTRSVQKVVEVCATSLHVIDESFEEDDPEECDYGKDAETERRRTTTLPDLIVEALKDDAVRLCIDSNGNHVIQRALQYMKPESNQFVFEAVCKECTTVGTHRHGCCVLQRCLDAANKTQKSQVIEQVERQAMKLMQDPYGNYVVQYVLDSCTAEEAYGVIMKPLGHIFELSIQKFSSNVIEKCLEKAPERVRQQYIAEITNCPKLNKMLQDQFANYVVQRALCVCAEEQCLLLVKAIRPHLAAMKNTSGGRRITARILKRFPTMDIGLDGGMGPNSDNFFDTGVNSMMMGHLSVATGGYMHSQPVPSGLMYGIRTTPQFQGRDTRLQGSDGTGMMLNDGRNATSRA